MIPFLLAGVYQQSAGTIAKCEMKGLSPLAQVAPLTEGSIVDEEMNALCPLARAVPLTTSAERGEPELCPSSAESLGGPGVLAVPQTEVTSAERERQGL